MSWYEFVHVIYLIESKGTINKKFIEANVI